MKSVYVRNAKDLVQLALHFLGKPEPIEWMISFLVVPPTLWLLLKTAAFVTLAANELALALAIFYLSLATIKSIQNWRKFK